jgi:hypothetical protein
MKVVKGSRSTTAFVEFVDVSTAMLVHQTLQGAVLQSSDRGGVRLQFSKNPFGRRDDAPCDQGAPPTAQAHAAAAAQAAAAAPQGSAAATALAGTPAVGHGGGGLGGGGDSHLSLPGLLSWPISRVHLQHPAMQPHLDSPVMAGSPGLLFDYRTAVGGEAAGNGGAAPHAS